MKHSPDGQGPLQLSPYESAANHVVGFYRALFAGNPPGSFRYLEGVEESNSEIWIGRARPVHSSVVGQRPAITVLYGAAAAQGLGLGDTAYFNPGTGTRVKVDIHAMTLTVNIVSKADGEAAVLGNVCYQAYWASTDEIARRSRGLILASGQRAVISPVGDAAGLVDQTGWYLVTISIPMFLNYSVTSSVINRPALATLVPKINT